MKRAGYRKSLAGAPTIATASTDALGLNAGVRRPLALPYARRSAAAKRRYSVFRYSITALRSASVRWSPKV